MFFNRYLKRMSGAVRGELGENTNPICCDDPGGEKEYLNRIRDLSGKRPTFVRRGSVTNGPYGNALDKYLLTSPEAPDREVYMDMYHRNYIEREPIPGYLIFNFDAEKLDRIPSLGCEDLQELTKFSLSLENAVKGDELWLRQILKFSHSTDACSRILTFTISLILFSYGEDREKVVAGLVRNPEFGIDRESADKVFTFITGS